MDAQKITKNAYEMMGAQKTDAYKMTGAEKTREYELKGAQKTDAYEPKGETYELINQKKSCVHTEKVQNPCVQNSSCVGVRKNDGVEIIHNNQRTSYVSRC